jgi:hypothetical protein
MQLCEHLLAVSSSEKSSKLKTQRLCLKTEQKKKTATITKTKLKNKTKPTVAVTHSSVTERGVSLSRWVP